MPLLYKKNNHSKLPPPSPCDMPISTGAVMVVIVWQMDLQLPMQSVTITTDVVNSNLDQCEVYNCVIKFVSDLQYVGGFLRVLGFPPPTKRTSMI
jgi:hypothetical protein